MSIALGIKNLLPIVGLVLGVAALAAPRFAHYIYAAFMIAFGLVGLGFVR